MNPDSFVHYLGDKVTLQEVYHTYFQAHHGVEKGAIGEVTKVEDVPTNKLYSVRHYEVTFPTAVIRVAGSDLLRPYRPMPVECAPLFAGGFGEPLNVENGSES